MKFEIDSLVKILLRILSVKGWGEGERLAAEFRPYFTLLNEQKSGAVVISSAIRERGEQRGTCSSRSIPVSPCRDTNNTRLTHLGSSVMLPQIQI